MENNKLSDVAVLDSDQLEDVSGGLRNSNSLNKDKCLDILDKTLDCADSSSPVADIAIRGLKTVVKGLKN